MSHQTKTFQMKWIKNMVYNNRIRRGVFQLQEKTMAETTTKKTAKKAAKPKAKTVSTTNESVLANPITKKGAILGGALVLIVLLSMLIGS